MVTVIQNNVQLNMTDDSMKENAKRTSMGNLGDFGHSRSLAMQCHHSVEGSHIIGPALGMVLLKCIVILIMILLPKSINSY